MTHNYEWLTEHPYWTFDNAMDVPATDFPIAWKDYWGIGDAYAPDHLDPDEWQTANQMHDIARRICAVAASLQGGLPEQLRTLPPVLGEESRSEQERRQELATLLREKMSAEQLESPDLYQVIRWLEWEEGPAEGKEKLFRTAVEIYAYQEFGCSPGTIGFRVLKLLDYIVRASGERTREYLRRVAACYIRDMPPEMAVMSRSVIEAALQFPEVEERIEFILKTKGKRHPSLIDWIDSATDLGVLDPDGRVAADLIKNAGDDAVHNVPQGIPDSSVILLNLNRVLSQIDRHRRRNR
jgi:hypothetical protein